MNDSNRESHIDTIRPNTNEPLVSVLDMSPAFTEVATKQDMYLETAPVVRYVQQRVDVLSNQRKLKVHIIHDDEVNAFTDGEEVYIYDGLLKRLEFEEELDGVLAHEISHIAHDHVSQRGKTTRLARLGTTRTQETEADLRALKLLDDRGINPQGLISVVSKLDEMDEKTPRWLRHSAEYGSNQDRRVNLNQSLWLADARHLGPIDKMTPMMITPDEYGQVLDHQYVINNYSDLGPNIQQLALARELQSKPTDRMMSVDEIYEKQRTLLAACNPKASVESIEQSTKATIYCLGKPEETIPISTLADQVAQNLEVLKDHNSVLSATQLQRRVKSAIREVLDSNFQEHLDDPGFVNAVRTMRDAVDDADFLTRELLEHTYIIADDPAQDLLRSQKIAQLFGEGTYPIAALAMGTYAIKPNQDITFSDVIKRSERMATIVGKVRKEQVIHIDSPGKLLLALADFGLPLINTYEENNRRLDIRVDDNDSLFVDKSIQFEFDQWGVEIKLPADQHQDYPGEDSYEQEDDEFVGRIFRADEEPEEINSDLLDDPDDYSDQINDSFKLFNGVIGNTLRYMLETTPSSEIIKEVFRHSNDRHEANKALSLGIDIFAQLGWAEQAFSLALASNNNDIVQKLAPVIIRDYGNLQTRINPDGSRRTYDEIVQSGISEMWFSYGFVRLNELRKDVIKAIPKNDRQTILSMHEMVHSSMYIKAHAAMQLFSPNSEELPINIQLETFLKDFGMVTFRDIEQIDPTGQSALVTRWTEAMFDCMRSFGKPGDLGEIGPKNLHKLLTLSSFAEDIEVRLSVPASILREIIRRQSFDQAMETIFDTYGHLPGYVTGPSMQYMIETKAQTIKELEQFTERFEQIGLAALENNADAIGALSIVDTYIVESYQTMRGFERESALKTDSYEGMQASDLLAAILMTGQNAQPLKEYLFNRWWALNRNHPETREDFLAEDYIVWRHPSKEARLKWWLAQQPAGNYMPLEAVTESAFLSNSMSRYVALRKILLGEGGALTDHEGRHQLITALEKSWLTFVDEPEAHKTVDGMLRSLVDVNNAEELYQYISPVLQELILRPPQHPTDDQALAANKANELLENLVRRDKIREYGERDTRNMTNRVRKLIEGGAGYDFEQISNNQHIKAYLLGLNGSQTESGERIDELSPVRLAILLGKKSGAIGVRMLQLGGQYYQIPNEDKEAFKEIYDQVQGQSRIQAYALLKREAEYAPEIADLMENIVRFGERIGGGSLMTVYEVETKDSGRQVIGVRNPNAQWHVANIASMVDKTLEHAISKDPENIDLQLARSLVYDAVDWIARELNDVNFNAKDAVFKAENDRRSQTGKHFRTGRAQHRIYVPDTQATGSLWVRREEFIDGNNLNNLEVAETTDITAGKISKDDLRDVTSVLIRNYTHQLLNGSFAHSDIHPGNFRVTSDNKDIAVLDRYNLIEVTPELRGKIKNLFKGFAAGNTKEILDVFVGDETPLAPGVIAQITTKLSDTKDKTKAVTEAIIELKKQGVAIPIETSLIIRNIFSLLTMAKDAGFDSIVDGFMHTAEPDESVELLSQLSA